MELAVAEQFLARRAAASGLAELKKEPVQPEKKGMADLPRELWLNVFKKCDIDTRRIFGFPPGRLKVDESRFVTRWERNETPKETWRCIRVTNSKRLVAAVYLPYVASQDDAQDIETKLYFDERGLTQLVEWHDAFVDWRRKFWKRAAFAPYYRGKKVNFKSVPHLQPVGKAFREWPAPTS